MLWTISIFNKSKVIESHNNMLPYGLSILNWEKMYGNVCNKACGNAINWW